MGCARRGEGGIHQRVQLLMDSQAAITCQPCYYTHHHSERGSATTPAPWRCLAPCWPGKPLEAAIITHTVPTWIVPAAAPLPVPLATRCIDAIQCCPSFPLGLVCPAPQQTCTVQIPWHISATPVPSPPFAARSAPHSLAEPRKEAALPSWSGELAVTTSRCCPWELPCCDAESPPQPDSFRED